MPSGSSTSEAKSCTPAATDPIVRGGCAADRASLTIATSSSKRPALKRSHTSGTSSKSGPSPVRFRTVSSSSRCAWSTAPFATCRPKRPRPRTTHSGARSDSLGPRAHERHGVARRRRQHRNDPAGTQRLHVIARPALVPEQRVDLGHCLAGLAHQLRGIRAEQDVAVRGDAPKASREGLGIAPVVFDLELHPVAGELLPDPQPVRSLPTKPPVATRQRQARPEPQTRHRIATSYRN